MTLPYDAVGNMTSDGMDCDYTTPTTSSAAWLNIANAVSDASEKSYSYNGLARRITDPDGTAEHLVYKETWQLLARFERRNVREQWLPQGPGLTGTVEVRELTP